MSALVSVIIPVYNKAAYLSACLDGVLRQTYRELELLLIEDCSGDDSRTVCEAYAKADGRVRLIQNAKNLGAAESRNRGLREAKGEWIAFVDADDVPDARFIETMLKAAAECGADAAVCGFTYESPDGKTLGRFSVPRKEMIAEGRDCLAGLIRLYPVETRYDIALWNKLYKRSLLEGIFMEDLCSEDYLFNAQAFLCAERVVHLPVSLYRAVQSPNSFSRQALNKKTLSAVDADRKVLALMEKERPDLVPGALERLITQCGDYMVLARKNCSMDKREAIAYIGKTGRDACKYAKKYAGTEAERAARRKFVDLYVPFLHDPVNKVYSFLSRKNKA